MYELLVGEIGIDHHTFLYELKFYQVRRIIRGYRRRNILTHQMLAEVVFSSIYAMRDPKGKTVKDLFPALFEDEDEDIAPPLTDEERNELQELMKANPTI